ncbi:MAG: plasmid stabilization protein [Bauldia sp.]|nr:plasmid stabilization protein [Bauldia sp.]MCW5716780.1 plasmid stabilization protein [Bauldia sp.]
MASLTVRGLDDDTKQRLRVRAATKGVSLEEEVRRILREAVNENAEPKTWEQFFGEIDAVFEEVEGVDLELPPRESDWTPPDFSTFPIDPDDGPGPGR